MTAPVSWERARPSGYVHAVHPRGAYYSLCGRAPRPNRTTDYPPQATVCPTCARVVQRLLRGPEDIPFSPELLAEMRRMSVRVADIPDPWAQP
jgi:hypothetical protein